MPAPVKAGQFDARHVTVASGAADTEFTVAHGLDRTPVEAFVVLINEGGVVYRGTTAWDGTNIYLRTNTANTLFTLLVF